MGEKQLIPPGLMPEPMSFRTPSSTHSLLICGTRVVVGVSDSSVRLEYDVGMRHETETVEVGRVHDDDEFEDQFVLQAGQFVPILALKEPALRREFMEKVFSGDWDGSGDLLQKAKVESESESDSAERPKSALMDVLSTHRNVWVRVDTVGPRSSQIWILVLSLRASGNCARTGHWAVCFWLLFTTSLATRPAPGLGRQKSYTPNILKTTRRA